MFLVSCLAPHFVAFYISNFVRISTQRNKEQQILYIFCCFFFLLFFFVLSLTNNNLYLYIFYICNVTQRNARARNATTRRKARKGAARNATLAESRWFRPYPRDRKLSLKRFLWYAQSRAAEKNSASAVTRRQHPEARGEHEARARRRCDASPMSETNERERAAAAAEFLVSRTVATVNGMLLLTVVANSALLTHPPAALL